jgi:hypothetical protein
MRVRGGHRAKEGVYNTRGLFTDVYNARGFFKEEEDEYQNSDHVLGLDPERERVNELDPTF